MSSLNDLLKMSSEEHRDATQAGGDFSEDSPNTRLLQRLDDKMSQILMLLHEDMRYKRARYESSTGYNLANLPHERSAVDPLEEQRRRFGPVLELDHELEESESGIISQPESIDQESCPSVAELTHRSSGSRMYTSDLPITGRSMLSRQAGGKGKFNSGIDLVTTMIMSLIYSLDRLWSEKHRVWPTSYVDSMRSKHSAVMSVFISSSKKTPYSLNFPEFSSEQVRVCKTAFERTDRAELLSVSPGLWYSLRESALGRDIYYVILTILESLRKLPELWTAREYMALTSVTKDLITEDGGSYDYNPSFDSPHVRDNHVQALGRIPASKVKTYVMNRLAGKSIADSVLNADSGRVAPSPVSNPQTTRSLRPVATRPVRRRSEA